MSAAHFEPGACAVAHVYETKDELVLSVEIPDVDPEELLVTLFDHTVTVTGGRDPDPEWFGKTNRMSTAFRREFQLPPTADVEHLRAVLKDGALELHAPKGFGPRPRRIEVHVPYGVHGDSSAD